MKRFLIGAALLALASCDAATTTTSSLASDGGEAHTLSPADLSAFFDCLQENGQTLVSAHRGGPSRGYAENALNTMAHTLSNGPAFLEIDIARTSDGALVLMHDDTLERTTNGEGAVSEITLADFQALSLRDETGTVLDESPPTLRQALDWAAGQTVLELDIKRGVRYEDVFAEVREAGAMDRVIFITYSVEGAARMARLAPEAMLYATVEREGDLDALESRGVDLSSVIAWTGTHEPNSDLYVTLAERGVEARFGTLGGGNSWDARFEREGDQYSAFAETGIEIIATDRPAEAARDLDANDGVDGFGAKQCETAR